MRKGAILCDKGALQHDEAEAWCRRWLWVPARRKRHGRRHRRFERSTEGSRPCAFSDTGVLVHCQSPTYRNAPGRCA